MARVAQLVDRSVATAVGVMPFFSEGWGDPNRLASLIERSAAFEKPKQIDINWHRGRQRWDGLHAFRGYFESPDMSLRLPPESRTAYVEFLLPEDAFEGASPPVCVHLAGSGDATYVGRRTLMAPLARREGIGSIILQNPYYGERAPEGQSGTQLRTVADHLAMNIATIEEARSLLEWLYRDGYQHLAVAGYSMGGYMAAISAQLSSRPLAVSTIATANSPVETILESPLTRAYDWATLDAQLGDDGSARDLMAELMTGLEISSHGSLAYPEYAVVAGGIRDEFVPPHGVLELHRHWRGSELHWIDAGHTTGWALHGKEIRNVIARSIDRLVAGERATPSPSDGA